MPTGRFEGNRVNRRNGTREVTSLPIFFHHKKHTMKKSEIRAIADAHIKARVESFFDDPKVSTKQELFECLINGTTFSELMFEIEKRFVSITSNMYASVLNYQTEAYKRGIRKGFYTLFENYAK